VTVDVLVSGSTSSDAVVSVVTVDAATRHHCIEDVARVSLKRVYSRWQRRGVVRVAQHVGSRRQATRGVNRGDGAGDDDDTVG
jgi:hypothetical protein